MKIGRYDFPNITNNANTSNVKVQEDQGSETDFSKELEKAASAQTSNNSVTGTEEEDLKKLKSASEDLEAVFLNMMFKSMRATIGDGGLVEKSYGQQMYEDMLYEEISKNMSKGSKGSLSETLYEQLKKDYETTGKIPKLEE